mmetsp:Transcript_8479/g.18479  ORF Transcript_8479/g.18479 Transcript_8479/m.18479 type:complete len:213 (+) Transcript_8479:524-1162(+)
MRPLGHSMLRERLRGRPSATTLAAYVASAGHPIAEHHTGAIGHPHATAKKPGKTIILPAEEHGGAVLTKERFEYLVSLLEGDAAVAARPSMALKPRFPELVVRLPLIRVMQSFVGFGDLLEVLLSSLLVVRVLVWVVLQGQFLVGFANLVIGRTAFHSKDSIEVLRVDIRRRGHSSRSTTLAAAAAGRRRLCFTTPWVTSPLPSLVGGKSRH